VGIIEELAGGVGMVDRLAALAKEPVLEAR
jgi:hypothetical protein